MVTPLMIIKTHIHAKSDDTMKDFYKSHKMDIATILNIFPQPHNTAARNFEREFHRLNRTHL